MVAALLFGALVVGATALLWRSPCRPLGFVLIGSWAASNVAQLYAPVEARETLNTIIDIVAFSAFAFLYMRKCRGVAAASMLVLTALSVTASLAQLHSADRADSLNSYEIALNVIFVIECLCLGVAGLADVVDRWQINLLARAADDWLRADEARRVGRFSEGNGEWKS